MTVYGSDAFAGAEVLPLGSSSLPTNTATATAEPGEPTDFGTRSLWWRVTLTADTPLLSLDLLQSTGADFSPTGNVGAWIVLYEGSDVASLTRIGDVGRFANDFEAYGNRPEYEVPDVPAGTYHVAVRLDSWSGDFTAVLRVASAEMVWGDWTQRPDYTLDHVDLADQYTELGDHWTGVHGDIYADIDTEHHLAEITASLSVPKAKGAMSGANVVGFRATASDIFLGEYPYDGASSGVLRMTKLAEAAYNSSRTPVLEYHFAAEEVSPWSDLVGVDFTVVPTTHSSAEDEEPIATSGATVLLQDVPNADAYDATWPAWDYEGAAGATEATLTNDGSHGAALGPITLSLSPDGPERGESAMARLHPTSPQFALTNPLGTGEVGFTFTYAWQWRFHPPLIRYQDKVLLTTTRPRSWLRHRQRGDGYGASSAPRGRQNNTQQASLRGKGIR